MTDAYRPIIVAPQEVLSYIDPAFAQCSPELRGLFDPPSALTQANVVAAPTTPNAEPTEPPASPQAASARLTSIPQMTRPSTGGDASRASAEHPPSAGNSQPQETGLATTTTSTTLHDQAPSPTTGNGEEAKEGETLAISQATTAADPVGLIVSILGAGQQASASQQDGLSTEHTIVDGLETTPDAATSTINPGGIIASLLNNDLPDSSQEDSETLDPAIMADASSEVYDLTFTAKPTTNELGSPSIASYDDANKVAVVTLDGIAYSAEEGKPLLLGSSTISFGGPAVTVGHQVASVARAGIAVYDSQASDATAQSAVFLLSDAPTTASLSSSSAHAPSTGIAEGDVSIDPATETIEAGPVSSADTTGGAVDNASDGPSQVSAASPRLFISGVPGDFLETSIAVLLGVVFVALL